MGLKLVAQLCGGLVVKDKRGEVHYDMNGRKVIVVKKAPNKGMKQPLLGGSSG